MQYYIDTEKTVWRSIDNEAIILNLDSGAYYSLNKTGSLIWNLISEQKSVEEIIRYIADEYHMKEAVVRKDVISMISHFEKELLISSQSKSVSA